MKSPKAAVSEVTAYRTLTNPFTGSLHRQRPYRDPGEAEAFLAGSGLGDVTQ